MIPSPHASGALRLDRRRLLQGAMFLGAGALLPEGRGVGETAAAEVESRIGGLLVGSALGDALGGPIEFQPPDQVHALANAPKRWKEDERLDAAARTEAARRLELRSYVPLRPQPESYGQWNVNSVAGTITDDTRHKLILLSALRVAEHSGQWPFGVRDLAQAFLDWPKSPAITGRPEYVALAADWLEEWQLGARWVLGERDVAVARPPERMWSGLPTCCGQMTLLPLAAVFAGEPEPAYRAAWQLGFFDNGWGKDLNAALVAGLATALVTPCDPKAPRAAWESILATMRRTDPYRYGKIRWTQRSVDRWLDFAWRTARDADGHPARLFATWDREFSQTTKWEAHVPVVVAFGCLALADYDPLAALQLTLEWGWDTDSYAQLLAAFLGALYGPDLFRVEWRSAVAERLRADHQVDLGGECQLLTRLRELSRRKKLIRDE